MFDLFLQPSGAIEWWFVGSAVLLFLLLLLFLISAIRHWRTLIWFYGASILVAALYGAALWAYPLLLEALVSFRSDWSLVFLTQNVSIPHLLSQLVLFFFVLSVLGIVLVVLLELWSLLTFRWARLSIILRRAFSASWFVLLFALFQVVVGVVWVSAFETIDFSVLHQLFGLTSFLFLLQFFVRLLDNAGLGTPKIYTEYLFATGFVLLYARFVTDGFLLIGEPRLIPQEYFLGQVYVFFLAVLLMGYMSAFFVRALFASEFYLQHYHRNTSLLSSWTSRLLMSPRDRHYAHFRIVMALVLTIVLGDLFVVLALQEWYLTLVPAFFLAYFFLFYMLDKQDDMKVRGDLVDQRIEKEVSRLFFG